MIEKLLDQNMIFGIELQLNGPQLSNTNANFLVFFTTALTQGYNEEFFKAGEVSWNKGTSITISSTMQQRKAKKFWFFFLHFKTEI